MDAAIATSFASLSSADSAADLSFARARFAHRRLEGWLMSAAAKALPEAAVEVEAERRGREIVRLMLTAHFRERGTGDVGPAMLVVHPKVGGPTVGGSDDAHPKIGGHEVGGSSDVATKVGGQTVGGSEDVGRTEAVVHGRRRVRPRTLATIVGPVPIARTVYAAPGRPSVHPLDGSAVLPARSFSHPLQRKMVLGAVRGPFDEAVKSVAESTGTRISKRSAEQVVADAAVDFGSFYERRAAEPPEKTGSVLVAAVDCKGVPMVKPEKALRTVRRGKGDKANKKRMATVAAVFTRQPLVRTPEDVVTSLFEDDAPTYVCDDRTRNIVARVVPSSDGCSIVRPPDVRPEGKRVWASLKKSKDEVIAEVAAEMRRRDPDAVKRAVVVTDGERALQRRLPPAVLAVRDRPGKTGEVTVVLDLPHALERLWKCAYCFHPEGSDEAKAWVRERALGLLRGRVGQVVKGIRQSATKRGISGVRRRTIDAATAYLHRNRERMRYDEYLRDGLPIASGSVEGACKNLIKDRMERSGMRWGIDGAEAIVQLRAVERSGDFDEYWDHHVLCEHARLHPPDRWTLAAK